MNQRNENNIENITWAPRVIPMQLSFNDFQERQRQRQMDRNQRHVNNLININTQTLEQNYNDFEIALENFFIERFERRIIENNQRNNIFYSQQKHPNNIINNYQ